MNEKSEELTAWQNHLSRAAPGDILAWAAQTYPGEITLATSLGAEGVALIHLMVTQGLKLPVFMLDTGRLFEEHYRLLEQIQARYGIAIRLYFPNQRDVEQAVSKDGPNYFRESIQARQHCCEIRKVRPLQRALAGYRGWIAGLRRDQALTRGDILPIQWDGTNGLYKIAPLWNWSQTQVWDLIRANDIPYNPLHDRGFTSIGCAPCTRPVAAGEDARSGRWWWERAEHKECGLHFSGGRLVRVPA